MKWLVTTALLVAGCQAGLLTDDPVAGSADASPTDPPTSTDDAPPAEPARAVLDLPRHGQIYGAATTEIPVHGWSPTPGDAITLEALDAGTWVGVGAATSGTVAGIGADAGMYELSTTLSRAALASVWPAGGVLRLRATTAEGEPLAVFGDDVESTVCLAERGADDWTARATACAFPVTRGAALVSVADGATPEPAYLDRKGAITAAQTSAYYDVTDAAATLDEFRTRYGFGGAGEVSAAYYNRGDLAVGRDMHCTEFDAAGAAPGLACYSSNYGEFGGDAAIATAASIVGFESGASEGAFATVAMVYTPPIDAANSVSFVVFGADGARVDEAQLDRVGDNVSVPNNCMNCHGSASAYDPATSLATGARFLPFDPLAMAFADVPGYSMLEQAEDLRRLNALVQRNAPAPGVTDFLTAMYPTGVETPNAPAAFDVVPTGWTSTLADRAVYREVIAPICRGCHQTHVGAGGVAGPLAFRDALSFRAMASQIGAQICGTSPGMPNAEVGFNHLRRGAMRAYLVDYLDLDDVCVR